jgi:hypothetical protein
MNSVARCPVFGATPPAIADQIAVSKLPIIGQQTSVVKPAAGSGVQSSGAWVFVQANPNARAAISQWTFSNQCQFLG